MAAVIRQVAADYNIPVNKLLGPIGRRRKDARCLEARDLAMWMVRSLRWGRGHASYPQIGTWFGMDHATVIRAVRRVSEECALSPQWTNISVESSRQPVDREPKRESMAA